MFNYFKLKSCHEIMVDLFPRKYIKGYAGMERICFYGFALFRLEYSLSMLSYLTDFGVWIKHHRNPFLKHSTADVFVSLGFEYISNMKTFYFIWTSNSLMAFIKVIEARMFASEYFITLIYYTSISLRVKSFISLNKVVMTSYMISLLT